MRAEGSGRALMRVGSVKIRTAAQHGNAAHIDETGLRSARQRCEDRIVLLLRGAIDPLPAREQAGPAARALAQPPTRPPRVGGQSIALNHAWRSAGRSFAVVFAIRAQLLA